MQLLATLGILIVCSYSVAALGVDDFVPSFLLPSTESKVDAQAESIPVKPLVVVPRNSSTSKSWYCNRNQGGNVFCNKSTTAAVVKSYTYESNSSGDKTKVVDNSVTGINFGKNTAANQETLQNQDLKNTLQKNQGGFMVPIAPTDKMNMNINPMKKM